MHAWTTLHDTCRTCRVERAEARHGPAAVTSVEPGTTRTFSR
jgi:hypothetical protein